MARDLDKRHTQSSVLDELHRVIQPIVRRHGAGTVAEALRQVATSLDERRPDAMSHEERGLYDRTRQREWRRAVRGGAAPAEARATARRAALEAVGRARQGLPEIFDDRSPRRATKRLWTDSELARIKRARDAAYNATRTSELGRGAELRSALLAAQAAARAAAAAERERIRAPSTKRQTARPAPKSKSRP